MFFQALSCQLMTAIDCQGVVCAEAETSRHEECSGTLGVGGGSSINGLATPSELNNESLSFPIACSFLCPRISRSGLP